MAKSKIADLRAQREKVETADAIRLQIELARATCESCGQKPRVYCTRGEKRYVRCACGRSGQVRVERGIVRWLKSLSPEEFEAVLAAEEAPAQKPESEEAG